MKAFDDVSFSSAVPHDAVAVRQLLVECGLPDEDIVAHFEHFIVAKSGGEVAGVIGLQPLGSTGLLRSLAVRTRHRSKGLARDLCQRLIAYAKHRGIAKLYLLTTGASGFFRRMQFTPVERSVVPLEVRQTEEFARLCPDTADIMARDL